MKQIFPNSEIFKESLLKISWKNEDICNFGKEEIHKEKYFTIGLKSCNEPLIIRDKQGKETFYDISSLSIDGDLWALFAIWINPNHTAQAECVLTIDENLINRKSGNQKKVRLEPFYLSDYAGDLNQHIGKGLFARGLNFKGHVTPYDVSLLSLCDFCKKTFRIQSFHSGFNNLLYFYCNSCTNTLVADTSIEKKIIDKSKKDKMAIIDSTLPTCKKCGGSFRYFNPFLCPHCKKPYIDFIKYPEEREVEYYGNYLYGEKPQSLSL